MGYCYRDVSNCYIENICRCCTKHPGEDQRKHVISKGSWSFISFIWDFFWSGSKGRNKKKNTLFKDNTTKTRRGLIASGHRIGTLPDFLLSHRESAGAVPCQAVSRQNLVWVGVQGAAACACFVSRAALLFAGCCARASARQIPLAAFLVSGLHVHFVALQHHRRRIWLCLFRTLLALSRHGCSQQWGFLAHC